MAAVQWPIGSTERAIEDLAVALVPVAHDLRYGLETPPDRTAYALEKIEAMRAAGGTFEAFEEVYEHLSDALHDVWGA